MNKIKPSEIEEYRAYLEPAGIDCLKFVELPDREKLTVLWGAGLDPAEFGDLFADYGQIVALKVQKDEIEQAGVYYQMFRALERDGRIRLLKDADLEPEDYMDLLDF